MSIGCIVVPSADRRSAEDGKGGVESLAKIVGGGLIAGSHWSDRGRKETALYRI